MPIGWLNRSNHNKTYTKKFKRKVVDYVIKQGYSQSAAARFFNTSSKNVQRWVKQFKNETECNVNHVFAIPPIKKAEINSDYIFVHTRIQELEKELAEKEVLLNQSKKDYDELDSILAKEERMNECLEKEIEVLKENNLKLQQHIISSILQKS